MWNNINRTWICLQGLKRSVTTLRGGTLGYAEIVAVKVRQVHFPRNVAHCRYLTMSISNV